MEQLTKDEINDLLNKIADTQLNSNSDGDISSDEISQEEIDSLLSDEASSKENAK